MASPPSAAAPSSSDSRLQAQLAEKVKELHTVRHRCRALVVAKDAELSKLQEQLTALQQQNEQQQKELRKQPPSSMPSFPPPMSASSSVTSLEGAAGGGDVGSMSTEAGLLATARAQAMQDSELHILRTRAASLEARIRGATEARRAWGLREAELVERVEQLEKLAEAQGRMQDLEYLRAVILKYFELGPGSFDDIFPLLTAFLEFSLDEQKRIKEGHAAHMEANESTVGWLLGGGSSTATGSAPSSAASARPSANMPLPPFPQPSLAIMSPTMGALPLTPGTRSSAISSVAAPASSTAGTGAGASNAVDTEKLDRMRKLLEAADMRLEQAQATIEEKNATIHALEGTRPTPRTSSSVAVASSKYVDDADDDITDAEIEAMAAKLLAGA